MPYGRTVFISNPSRPPVSVYLGIGHSVMAHPHLARACNGVKLKSSESGYTVSVQGAALLEESSTLTPHEWACCYQAILIKPPVLAFYHTALALRFVHTALRTSLPANRNEPTRTLIPSLFTSLAGALAPMPHFPHVKRGETLST